TIGGNDDEARLSRSRCSRQYETVEENGCDGEIDDVLRIKLREAGSNKEIFTSMAWIRAFNINEPIYLELCHEFYSTYEFSEVYADDELLGFNHAEELDEEGFDVYFQGGLHSDEHFNTQEYWLSISREENLSLFKSQAFTIRSSVLRKNDLWLLSMFDARYQNGYANVAWLIAIWMKRKGAGIQKESQFFCGQFMTKIVRKARVLSDVVLRSLSALIYCTDLDTTTMRELIDSEGRLIPEDP
nr:hypothetical protein [Tanacetum cinerariifolium]